VEQQGESTVRERVALCVPKPNNNNVLSQVRTLGSIDKFATSLLTFVSDGGCLGCDGGCFVGSAG